MRSRVLDRQKLWFVRLEEGNSGLDNIPVYGKPVLKRMTVSSTSGTTEEIAGGIQPDYDRYITSYDTEFNVEEGDRVFVDRIPKMDSNGNLRLSEDGYPVTEPDYRVDRIIGTQKGGVVRYGITKVGVERG